MTQFLDTPVDKSLSATGAWTDIDLSGDVPVTATGAIFRVINQSVGTCRAFGLRKKGSADDHYKDVYNASHLTYIVGVDSNRKCEGKIESVNVNFWLIGFTEGDGTIFTTAIDKSLGVTNAWTDIDLSSQLPVGATAAIFDVEALGSSQMFGLRKKGSTDEHYDDIYSASHLCFIVGVDSNRKCEGKIESVNVNFWLMGYLTGATAETNGVDRSLGTTGSYVDITESNAPDGATGVFVDVLSPSPFRNYAARKNGASDDTYMDTPARHYSIIVGIDSNKKWEGKIEITSQDFYTLGYFVPEVSVETKESSIGVSIQETPTLESSIGLSIQETPTKESTIGLRVVTQRTKESSIGLRVVHQKTKTSSTGLTIQETFTKESSIGLTIQETFTKESSIGLRVVHQKTKTSSTGLTIQETFTKESSIGLTIQETFTKESSIGLTIQETFTKESSIGLRVVHQKTKTSSTGLTIQETPIKESSIGMSVGGESEVVSIIGIRVVNSETKESTLGMTISGDETKESSINLSILGTFTNVTLTNCVRRRRVGVGCQQIHFFPECWYASSIGISVQETFTKESSIGMCVVTQKTKESSINLTVWDTPIKESSIGMHVLACQVKDSTIGMYVEGANTKDSSIGITVTESVLKKGFYYAKLGNIVLEGVEEDNFRISKEINQIPSFNYEIANCAVNRTTIADNITEEFKIYWRHHGTDTHIFTGIINADGIEYISLDSIEITGYASYVVLSWPLLKHLAAEDAEPVNKVFDFYGAYTDLTTQANNATINDVVLSLSNSNHGLYIGEKQPFWGAQIKYSTKGVRPEGCNIILEYSRGGGFWGTLDALDESDAFTEDPGTYNLIIAHPPSDWGRNIVDGVKRYWIRWRLAAGVYTTPPKLDQIYIVNVDVYRTYYFDTSARAILLDALEGTDYTMDATDSCPEDIISVVAEYESPLRVIAAIPNALTWTDDESSKKSYQWWIDDNKKVHMKQQRGTVQPDDITGDMTIFNNHEDYFHLSNRLIGLGPRDGLGQMRAIIEDKTSIATHTLREIAVAKDQSLKYNMLKTSLEKDLAISKNPMQRIRGNLTTEFWGLRGYEVGDTVTLHQGKWNVPEKAFQIVKVEIGPNTTTIDLGISQDHLNGLRDSLQRQLTLNNVRMHGSTTLLEAGPTTSNYQRVDAETVYPAKLEIEIPSTVKKVHKVLLSFTLGPYRADVAPNTGTIPAHDHEGTAGIGGAVDSFNAGAGGAFTPDVGFDGGFTPEMIGGSHAHLVATDIVLVFRTVPIGILGHPTEYPDTGKVFGGNHRHTKGRTGPPDDVATALIPDGCTWHWCEACDFYLYNEIQEDEFAKSTHWHYNSNLFTGYTEPNMYVNVAGGALISGIDTYAFSEMSDLEGPAGWPEVHLHEGVDVLDHDHAGIAVTAHSDHTIPLLVGHTDHAIIADTGGTVAIEYGIHEVAGGTDMELFVNGESIGIYTTAPQTEIRIDGWLNSGNNTVELQPKTTEVNKKGGATLKATGLLFVEPVKF